MDVIEFADWMEFYQMEPFGCETEDIRHAAIAMFSDQYRKRNRIEDYLPPWSERRGPRIMSEEQMKAVVKIAFGG